MRKILIADDEQGICLLLQELLETNGYETVTVQTGKEALDALKADSYALLIIDYKLPVLDGVEVLEQLNQEGSFTTPVIIMSGLVEQIDGRIKNMPFVKDVLAKPFNIGDLLSLIQAYVE
ncbi:MAG TPA: response regulator [Bacillota bacterium]|nr:response regulator [Bacillota bacterium]